MNTRAAMTTFAQSKLRRVVAGLVVLSLTVGLIFSKADLPLIEAARAYATVMLVLAIETVLLWGWIVPLNAIKRDAMSLRGPGGGWRWRTSLSLTSINTARSLRRSLGDRLLFQSRVWSRSGDSIVINHLLYDRSARDEIMMAVGILRESLPGYERVRRPPNSALQQTAEDGRC